MNKKIGIATIIYNQDGKVVSSIFKPTLETRMDTPALVAQLKSLQGSDDAEVIKHNADLTMATFFTEIDSIELADRDLYEIKSELLECEKFENGQVKKCVLEYTFASV